MQAQGWEQAQVSGMHKKSGSWENNRIAEPKSSLGLKLQVQFVYIVLQWVSTTEVKAKSLHCESELELSS